MAKRKAIPKSVRAAVVDGSNGVCCVCHRRGVGLNVHHLDENPSNNDPDNLCVLCVSDHDAHHRPHAYVRSHGDLTATELRARKEQWERTVADAKQGEATNVVAVVSVHGSDELVHSLRVTFQLDRQIVHERLWHVTDGSVDELVDRALDEISWLGSGITMAMLDEPIDVEYCTDGCGAYSRTLDPLAYARLLDPAGWSERVRAGIYINQSQPTLSIHIGVDQPDDDRPGQSYSVHRCRDEIVTSSEDGHVDAVKIRWRDDIRTLAAECVIDILAEWGVLGEQVFIGTGDRENPEFLDWLDLPDCWDEGQHQFRFGDGDRNAQRAAHRGWRSRSRLLVMRRLKAWNGEGR